MLIDIHAYAHTYMHIDIHAHAHTSKTHLSTREVKSITSLAHVRHEPSRIFVPRIALGTHHLHQVFARYYVDILFFFLKRDSVGGKGGI